MGRAALTGRAVVLRRAAARGVGAAAVVAGSGLDRVCLDIPPSVYATESAFRARLTGRQERTGSRPDFVTLAPSAGLPVRILLQRLDDERPVAARLDPGCADIAAVRAPARAAGGSPPPAGRPLGGDA
ncbi:hypothetical protein ACIHEJ_24035 [Streptomyces sp. NPDC052301]|uniref:hypothetical protein n=1 Tax=Streptomyces sp. NPDC052301 TaxID=3365687 RepID=UPI0037D96D8A